MSNPNIKTGICKYAFVGCKQLQKCWYAHNKEELRQRHCVNGMNCNDNNCHYLHPNQNIDKNEYFLKILLKSDVLGIDKDTVKKQLDIINTKLIIEFDNDIYEDDEEDIQDDIDLDLNKMNLKDKTEDDLSDDEKDLKIYIGNITEQWKLKPEQFYDKNDNKNEITLNIKVNDLQMEMLTNFMKTINIDFKIDSIIKNN